MYIKILISYILGYVNVTVEGFFIERFINTCVSKGILMWNMKRERATILKTKLSIKNFRKAVKIAKQTKCKIKIEEKNGLPFIFNRYRKRKIFAGACCLIVFLLIFLSNFIWNIEIVGTENINPEELIEILKQEGLETGKWKNSIKEKDIINKLRLDRSDIAWVGIELKGTNAIVQIVEAKAKPEIINSDEYCNIVATKDATVVKVNAQNGIPTVQEGSEVKKGDILVNGWIEGKYTGIRYLHAEGEILAKVKYAEKVKIYYNQTKSDKNGNEEKKYSIKFNNFQINFYKSLSKFEKYDTIRSAKKIKIFGDYYLPIEIIQNENFEMEEHQISYTQEEAKNIGVQEAERILNEKIEDKDKIVDKYINANESEEYIEIEVVYEVLESIGAKEKIVF